MATKAAITHAFQWLCFVCSAVIIYFFTGPRCQLLRSLERQVLMLLRHTWLPDTLVGSGEQTVHCILG